MAATDLITRERRRVSIRLPRPLWIGVATVVLTSAGFGLRFGLPFYRQHVAIREIKRLGGRVEMRPGGPEWWRRCIRDERLEDFQPVESIELGGTEFGDDRLAHISELTSLERLYLGRTYLGEMSRGIVDHPKQFNALAAGYSSAPPISDAGLMRLGGLKNLHVLSFDGTRITDAGLASVKELTGLVELDLSNTQITDARLRHLSDLTRLQTLD